MVTFFLQQLGWYLYFFCAILDRKDGGLRARMIELASTLVQRAFPAGLK